MVVENHSHFKAPPHIHANMRGGNGTTLPYQHTSVPKHTIPLPWMCRLDTYGPTARDMAQCRLPFRYPCQCMRKCCGCSGHMHHDTNGYSYMQRDTVMPAWSSLREMHIIPIHRLDSDTHAPNQLEVMPGPVWSKSSLSERELSTVMTLSRSVNLSDVTCY